MMMILRILVGVIAIALIATIAFGQEQTYEVIDFAEDDLRGALGLGLRHHVLQREEHRMLDSIFELDDLTVGNVMVHRSSVETLDISLSEEDIVKQINESPHSRLPVWEGEPDNIIGILHVKDFYKHYSGPDDVPDLRQIMNPPYFVPETTTIGQQLHEFKQHRRHMALVVDEYGDFEGAVTLEDIIEEIVGEIDDEHDIIRSDISESKDGSYIVSGHIAVRDLNRELDWNLPEEAVTLAGLLVEVAGRIPLAKETIFVEGYNCQILAKKNQAIMRVRVMPPEQTKQETNS